MQHVLRVLVRHLGQRAAGLQAVVEDDHVDGAEGVRGLLGQAGDERLVVEVPGDVHVVGLSGVELLPATGQQQPRALAAEVGAHRLSDPAAGAGDQRGDLLESHLRLLLGVVEWVSWGRLSWTLS